VLVGLYMLYILVLALLRPQDRAGGAGRRGPTTALLGARRSSLVPPLALIFIVLGSIIGASPRSTRPAPSARQAPRSWPATASRKAGRFIPAILALASSVVAIFALGSMFSINIKNIQDPTMRSASVSRWWLGAARRAGLERLAHLRIDTRCMVMIETAKTLAGVHHPARRGDADLRLPRLRRRRAGQGLPDRAAGRVLGQFIIVMAVIFLLGFFLDFIEIAVVVVPIVAPILLADPSANITAVWLGVMIGLNIQTSFLTPPFGFALFYLRGVAPSSVLTTSIYKGVVPFIMLQLVALGIVGYLPSLVNYLPTRLSLLGEQSPPPINPKLQTCIEETVFTRFQNEGDRIRSAITAARGLDMSVVPEKLATSFTESLDKAEETFKLLQDIKTAEQEMRAAIPAYAPLHSQVRVIERDIRRAEEDLKAAQTLLSRVRGDDEEAQERRAGYEARIAKDKAEVERLTALIPAEWKEKHETFKKLLNADQQARLAYRRNADQAYKPVAELRGLLEGAERLLELKPALDNAVALADGSDAAATADAIKSLVSDLGRVDGTSDLTKPLRDATRALERNPDDKPELKRLLTEAEEIFAAKVDWRQKAIESIGPGLETYEQAIFDTIGLRSQRRLPEETALKVAACMSHHRDVSMSF
jgi:hypothetical protein